MSGWHDAEELAQKVDSASDGMFVKLADDGDKVVGVFVGEPLGREVHWNGERYVSCIGEGCDFCAKGKKPSLRVAINFFQLPEKSLKVIEQGRNWFKDLLKVREKYGVEKWTFEIERHGASGDTKTTYTILPEEKISFELQTEIAKLELHDLENVISGEEKKEKFESYDKSKGETTQEPLINPQLASELIRRLKALPRSEVDELCAKRQWRGIGRSLQRLRASPGADRDGPGCGCRHSKRKPSLGGGPHRHGEEHRVQRAGGFPRGSRQQAGAHRHGQYRAPGTAGGKGSSSARADPAMVVLVRAAQGEKQLPVPAPVQSDKDRQCLEARPPTR